MSEDPRSRILTEARRQGFDAVGVTRAEADTATAARLHAFLGDGRHGEMVWMESRAAERASPQRLWDAARSVVMVGLNYGPATNPLTQLERRDRGAISVYAQGRDYHDVLKPKLKAFGSWIASTFSCDVKVFVDTAPVMEKPLAEAAGVGWQGKHTNLVSREFGSWLFLGAVFTTLDLGPSERAADRCGACRRCLDICPTDAFPAPYQLDARKCVSYLTIEHKGPIPREFRAAIGNRIYGCDDCLAVCPWNKFAQQAKETRFAARDECASPPLDELSLLDDAAFRKRFSGSPIKRTGRDRFLRNVAIAIGNSEESLLAAAATRLLDDASPLVRGAAIWALGRLAPGGEFNHLRASRVGSECDPTVRAEWLAES